MRFTSLWNCNSIDRLMMQCLFVYLMTWFKAFVTTIWSRETVGFEFPSTITLVLQANRLTKCIMWFIYSFGLSVITCDEITNTTKSVPTSSNGKKVACKVKNFCILLTFLLTIIAYSCYLMKYRAKRKQLITYYVTNNKFK